MKDPNVRPKRVCSPRYAVQKARKGKTLNRWELEELAKDPEQAVLYAQKVLKGRFLEAEPHIAQDPDHAFEYAKSVIKGRFEAAEKTLLEHNARWGHRNYVASYFIRLAKAPNPGVEKIILEENHDLIVEYAEECLEGRWLAAEKAVLKDWERAGAYQEKVIKARWPEFEDSLLKGKKTGFWSKRPEVFRDYLKNIGGRNDEIEEKLMQSSRASLLLVYAMHASEGRLPPALHQKMMMFSFDPKRQSYAKRYLKFLESRENRVVKYLSGLGEEEREALIARVRTN
jgi:hypothetical protein